MGAEQIGSILGMLCLVGAALGLVVMTYSVVQVIQAQRRINELYDELAGRPARKSWYSRFRKGRKP